MSKEAKIHFLTAYLEYLLGQGIKSENDYLGDASRFLRYLLRLSGPAEIEAFLQTARSTAYRRRLVKSLRKFYAFAVEQLDLPHNPMEAVDRAAQQGQRLR